MRLGYLEDKKGDRSMGRLIAFFGTIDAMFLSVIGASLSVYEVVANTETSAGASMLLLAVGMFTSGALLKGWQKTSEVKEDE